MKLSKSGRIALASVVSVGLGFGATACGPSNTIDFLYITASKQNPGQISVYKIDSEAGQLFQITDSPYGSGGRNPVADVASASGKHLYVVETYQPGYSTNIPGPGALVVFPLNSSGQVPVSGGACETVANGT